MLAERVVRGWYQGAPWLCLLVPLSWLFQAIVRWRRRKFLARQGELWQPPVPVIVVGNITVGGTGKSPLVAALVRHLGDLGWKPGVISRGYGGRAARYPLWVSPETEPSQAGDEPLMLARQLGVPVVVDPDRARAAQYLLQRSDCNLIISDDGLQHYRLKRDVELVVIDGGRGLGNGLCLPAGPLREPPDRLRQVDAIIVNGESAWSTDLQTWSMRLQTTALRKLADSTPQDIEEWSGRSVHGVAGIGNPERFFESLRALGLKPIPHAFPDHQQYRPQDLAFGDDLPIVMTAKDAVKCRDFVTANMYVLEVEAVLEQPFFALLERQLDSLKK